ncbi:MAG: hypothetical protein M1836_002871 [Candelina mexicana]|nr:MAG: hypothetical protein M1836_002871 [Candelina mexicana]
MLSYSYKHGFTGLLCCLLLQTAATSPTSIPGNGLAAPNANHFPDPGVEKRQTLSNIRIAGDDEYDLVVGIPKRDELSNMEDAEAADDNYELEIVKRNESILGGLAECARKQQPDWPHTQLTKAQSATCGKPKRLTRRLDTVGAPLSMKSSDGNYELAGICSTSDKVLKYFLFAGDFKDQAVPICTAAVDYPMNHHILAPVDNPFGVIGSEVSKVKARRKVGSTIWHTPNQRLDIITGMQNFNMNGDVASKDIAYKLCLDAVKYHGDTCTVGMFGTGNTPTLVLQHQSQKAGTVTWTDIKTGKSAIAFDFSLLDP